MKKITSIVIVLVMLFGMTAFARDISQPEISKAVSVGEISEAITSFSAFSDYAKMSNKDKDLIESLLEDRDYLSNEDFKKAFEQAVFVRAVNSSENISQINELIEKSELLTTGKEAYLSLNQSAKNDILLCLMNKNFGTFGQVEEVFSNAVNSVKNESSVSGGGGSGGGFSRPPVSYFIYRVEYFNKSTLQTTLMFMTDSEYVYDFSPLAVIAIYNKSDGRLIGLSQEVITITCENDWDYGVAEMTLQTPMPASNEEEFVVKAIMLDSLENMAPACETTSNGFVRNISNYSGSLLTLRGKCYTIPLNKADNYVSFTYSYIDAATAKKGWYINYDPYKPEEYFIPSRILRNGVDLKGLQGLELEIKLVVDEDGSFRLISASPRVGTNNMISVKPSLLASKDDYGYVRYYEDIKADKTTSFQIVSPDYMNVYNNLTRELYYYSSYNSSVKEANALPSNSTKIEYKYFDTDNDSIYDTVHVIDVKSFIAGDVNTTTNRIFRDMEMQNSDSSFSYASLILDPEDLYTAWSLKDETGKEIEISDVKSGQVVNIMESEDGIDTFYDVTVNDSMIFGVVSEAYSEYNKVMGMDETYYKIGDQSYQLFFGLSPLRPGDIIKAMIAANGKIIAYEITLDYKFGLITANNVAEDFGKTYQLQVLRDDGKIATLNLYSRFNDISSDYNISDTAFKADFMPGTLVVYQTNSKNEIKRIAPAKGDVVSTANYNLKKIDSTLTGGDIKSTYRESSKKLGTYTIKDDTVIFATETAQASVNRNNVSMGSKAKLVDDESYNGYVISDSSKNALAVVLFEAPIGVDPEDESPVVSRDYGIITGNYIAEDFDKTYQLQLLKSDGELGLHKLNSRFNGLTSDYNASDSAFSADFAPGQLVIYELNSDNEIKNIAAAGDALPPGVTVPSIDSAQTGGALSGVYNSSTGKIGAYTLTGDTAFFASDTIEAYVNKNSVGLSNKSLLTNGQQYSGYVISNSSGQALAIILFEAAYIEPEEPEELQGYQYGLITGLNISMDFGASYNVQMLKQDGNIDMLTLAERVNGMYMNTTAFQNYFSKGDLIAYKVNTKNEITRIGLASDNIKMVDESLDSGEISDYYYRSPGKIGDYRITANTTVFAAETTPNYVNQYNVGLAGNLIDGQEYNGYIIFNENNEAQAVVLFEMSNQVDWASYPMVITKISTVWIDGAVKVKYSGFVNGEEVQYITAADRADLEQFQTNDIILFNLNNKGEIIAAERLARINGSRYEFAVNSTFTAPISDYNDSSVQPQASYVSVLATKQNGKTHANYRDSFSGSAIKTSSYAYGLYSGNMKGYAVAGKAYDLRGQNLQLMVGEAFSMTKASLDGKRDYNTYNAAGTTVLRYDGLLTDVSVGSTLSVYSYNTGGNRTISTASIADLETDRRCADNYYDTQFDNDDFVYIYRYDGRTYLILIVNADGDR